MARPSLLDQAAPQGGLEDLLGCRVHVVAAFGLLGARERMDREAVVLASSLAD
jgi:hypothetical protein